jgi:hypothetical protein
MAYLVTGRWYFMEETQFAATVNYLGKNDSAEMRNGVQGLVQSCGGGWQTRSAAWMLRTLAQALAVTPDSDTNLRNEFINSMHANVDQYHAQYVAQANNPWGWVEPGENYSPNLYEVGAVWQQDFMTAAVGYSLALNLPIDSTRASKLSSFFAWKANSIIKRLGTSGGFRYINADVYAQKIASGSLTSAAYRTGVATWLSDADSYAVQAATLTSVSAPNGWMGSTDGTLCGEIMPGGTSLWGNALPAIAYAYEHGVSGASAAYTRLVSASNYGALAAELNTAPVWSVKPKGAIPAWLVGKPLNEWFQISGTSGAGGAVVDSWGAFAINDATSELYVACSGGHHDSHDNRVVSLSLAADAPVWTLRHASSSLAVADASIDQPYYTDGKPSSRHLYQHIHYVGSRNRIFLVGCRSPYGNGDIAFLPGGATVSAFDLTTNTWDASGTWASIPGLYGFGVVRDRNTHDLWTAVNGTMAKWNNATNTWSVVYNDLSTPQVRFPVAHDTSRGQFFTLQYGDSQGDGSAGVQSTKVLLNGGGRTTLTFNASAGLSAFIAAAPQYTGLDYDPLNDNFLCCHVSASATYLFKITPNSGSTWDMASFSYGAGNDPPVPGASGAGINGRFKYVPQLRGFVMLPRGSSNLYFMRTAL